MAVLKDTAWIIISRSGAGGGEDLLMALVLKLGLKIKVA